MLSLITGIFLGVFMTLGALWLAMQLRDPSFDARTGEPAHPRHEGAPAGASSAAMASRGIRARKTTGGRPAVRLRTPAPGELDSTPPPAR